MCMITNLNILYDQKNHDISRDDWGQSNTLIWWLHLAISWLGFHNGTVVQSLRLGAELDFWLTNWARTYSSLRPTEDGLFTWVRLYRNFSASCCFFSSKMSFDNFIQWSCRICFGLSFPSCIFFFNWYLFTFNWPFNMLWKASSVTLPRPPWYSKVLSTRSFTNKQHRCIKILVVVFAEIYIMRMTSKTC